MVCKLPLSLSGQYSLLPGLAGIDNGLKLLSGYFYRFNHFLAQFRPVGGWRWVRIAQGGGLIKLRRVRLYAFDFDNWEIALTL